VWPQRRSTCSSGSLIAIEMAWLVILLRSLRIRHDYGRDATSIGNGYDGRHDTVGGHLSVKREMEKLDGLTHTGYLLMEMVENTQALRFALRQVSASILEFIPGSAVGVVWASAKQGASSCRRKRK
jgi:hypothetical protein